MVEENRSRDREAPVFELIDALREAFAENHYFDVFIEWAKASPEDLLLRETAVNRSAHPAPIWINPLPRFSGSVVE